MLPQPTVLLSAEESRNGNIGGFALVFVILFYKTPKDQLAAELLISFIFVSFSEVFT